MPVLSAVIGRQSEGSLIRGFDNLVLTLAQTITLTLTLTLVLTLTLTLTLSLGLSIHERRIKKHSD